MNVDYKHFQVFMICLIFILLGLIGYVGYSDSGLGNQAHSEEVQALHLNEKAKREQKPKARPIKHKVVPSDYKHMISDGKSICHAEKLISRNSQYGPKSKKIKHRLNHNSKYYQRSYGIMHQLVSNSGATWNVYRVGWIDLPGWHLQFIPGSLAENGMYHGDFLVENHSGHIMGMLTAYYDTTDRQFQGLSKYDTYRGSKLTERHDYKYYPKNFGK